MNPEIWRDVFDVIEDPAFLHDSQFRVLRANRAYCRAAGVTEAQALGKPYWKVFPPGTGPLPGCKEAMLGKGDASSREEVSVGAKLFLSKGYPIRDDQGKYLYSLHLLSDISAQRQVTAALAESEERFRRATETARDAIITLDGKSGSVTSWNRAAEAMFGYGKEEVIGRVLNDFLPPPRFREAMTKGMAHFATTGEGATIDQTLELAALHKNGTEFPIELSLSAAQIHGKWHATGIARDISERKRAEEALRDNQARLDLALRSASMGVWHWDIIENRRYFDDQVCRLLGIDPRTFTGAAEEFFGAVHPDDRETIKAALARTKEQDVPYEREFRAVWPDGSVHYLTSRGRLVRDDKGRPARISGIAWDITERKKSEEGLKLFRALVDQSTDAIEVLDPETFRFLDVNQKACLDLGYSREELLSLSAFDIDHMLDRSGITEMIQELRKLGSLTHEGRHRRKDGSEFPVEVSLGYVLLDRAYMIAVTRDITERKLAQEALVRKERYYRKMIEGGSEVFFLIDRAGTFLYRNESGKQLTGWETAEVLGKPVTDFVSAESLPLVRNTMAEIFAKPGQLIRVEVSMLRKDGTQVEIEALAKNLLDDPDVAGIVITARDITERKKSEEGLKLFRALVDQSTDAIEVLDPETLRFLDVNQTACLNLGYSREELLSLNIFDIDPALDRSRSTEIVQQVRKLGSLIIEGRHRRKDGSEFPVEISIGYVQLDRAYMIAVTRDITERKQAESRLAEQLNELRQWHDVTLGRERRILDLKHEVNELLGQTGQPPRYPSAESDGQTEG